MLLFVVVDIVVCYCCCCFLLLLMFSCCSYPRSGSSSNLENVFFWRDENRRTWWKNPRSRKENKHQTQTTHIRTKLRDSNPGNIFGEPRALLSTAPVPRPKSGTCPRDNNKLSELILHQSRMKQSLFSICLAGLLK